jgi:hypothetical protein
MSDAASKLVRVFASTTSLLNEAAMLIELPSRCLLQVNQVFFGAESVAMLLHSGGAVACETEVMK